MTANRNKQAGQVLKRFCVIRIAAGGCGCNKADARAAATRPLLKIPGAVLPDQVIGNLVIGIRIVAVFGLVLTGSVEHDNAGRIA